MATISALFYDEDSAAVADLNRADVGPRIKLELTDPDSKEVVPGDGPRFARDFMLTTQGDHERI